MWTISNQSSASINVTDIPIPQEILPYTSGQFRVSDVLTSYTLSENLANGALVVTSMQSFGQTKGIWLPVTYVPHPMNQETQNGNSSPMTMGVFSEGTLLVNVTSISSGGSLALSWQNWDGTAFYPAQPILSSVTSTGTYEEPFSDYGIAGRLAWTVVGSVTFSATLQMRS